MTSDGNCLEASNIGEGDNETSSEAISADTREGMRSELSSLATSAAHDADQELAAAASLLVDLLDIAACMEQSTDFRERGSDIVDFCRQQALPAIRAAAGSHGADVDDLQKLQQEAAGRWSDVLELLTPDERFQAMSEPHSYQTDEAALWDRPLDSASPGTDDALEDQDKERQPGVFDMSLIMAKLGEPLAPEDLRDIRPAASTKSGSPFLSPVFTEKIEDPELIAAFCDDAQQCLAEMESCLLSLESGRATNDTLRQYCRQLHTLKGASGTVGLSQLAEYLHELESYVESQGGNEEGPDVETLLKGVDVVRGQLACFSPSGSSGLPETTFAEQRKASAAVEFRVPSEAASPIGAGTPADGEQFVRIEVSRLDRLMDLLAELVMLRNRRDTYVKSLHTLQDELNYCSARARSLISAVANTDSEVRQPAKSGIKGSSEALTRSAAAPSNDRLLSRSLAELSNDVTELGRTLHDVCEPLSEDNSAVSHLIGRFRQELMELRRLPLAGLFQRLHRTLRDAARAEGKQVELVVVGQGARAERSLQERLFEPLMHLVRNGVSHGIEAGTQRLSAGKSKVGTITLESWSDASYLFIEVKDDGRGLNDELLEVRGRELGLLPPGQSVSRERLWKLIFQPGFSTREHVSQISGRGVGMDIVDSWIRRLRGRIDVESVPGHGTTFRLQIPVRSAIEHAMVVRSDGQLFAFPMQSVNGTSDSQLPQELTPNGVRGDERKSLANRGSVLHLSQLLGMNNTQNLRPYYISLRDKTRREVSGAAPGKDRRDPEVTIAVDAVVGVEEVVVRSLPSLLQSHELFAGLTLSGQGETVLMLDVPGLIDLVELNQLDVASPQSGNEPGRERSTKMNAPTRILIVDDSVTIRRSLSRRLKSAGVSVAEASNGVDALKLLRCGGISAVVTDIDMPRMNGIELLQEMKHHRQLVSIPVIVLTSRDDVSTMAQLKDSGAAEILAKPVTEDTIAAIIAQVDVHAAAVR